MKPGSIVLCVDDSNWWDDIMEYFDKLPVKGELYTVRMIIPNRSEADCPREVLPPASLSIESILYETLDIDEAPY